MLTSDFDYDLPDNLIATAPTERRDGSRLMVIRAEGAPEHRMFRDVMGLLRSGDVLVLNDSKVIPARLDGQRIGGGFAEVTLIEERVSEPPRWTTLVRPGRKMRTGDHLVFVPGVLEGDIVDVLPDGERVIKFVCEPGKFRELLAKHATMPLPPYIVKAREDSKAAPPPSGWANFDRERYQTVYAANDGSVAAPTAGLHFSPDLLSDAAKIGVRVARVTLHVGMGTFKPIATDKIEDHQMHEERWSIGEDATREITAAKREGRRVIAVGTTSARTLESAADGAGNIVAGTGATRLMIAPGYRFRAVDALITNFHLPKSTLLLLVSAMCGRERLLAAYREAVERRYRFYSYGDAMFVERAPGV